MIDIADQLTTTYREVRTGRPPERPDTPIGAGAGAEEPLVGMILRRACSGSPAEVWDALTRRRHLARWFGPVTGCATPGARFTVEGRGSGRVVERDPRHSLTVTWHEAGTAGTVVTRMAPDGGDGTIVEITHTVHRPRSGSRDAPETGAATRGPDLAATVVLTAGPAWDLALLALRRHLEGSGGPDDARAAGQRFAQHALSAWVDATVTAGLATADELTRTVGERIRHLAPDLTR